MKRDSEQCKTNKLKTYYIATFAEKELELKLLFELTSQILMSGEN